DDEPTSHYGRLVCGDCGKFIKWLRDPKHDEWVEKRNELIDILLGQPISNWEYHFLKSKINARYWTDNQESSFQKIADKFDIPTNSWDKRHEEYEEYEEEYA
ncbi:MAG: hypothetical protein AAF378_21285, partial [Cyanobacteria bacterium P01_A01_bin.84]